MKLKINSWLWNQNKKRFFWFLAAVVPFWVGTVVVLGGAITLAIAALYKDLAVMKVAHAILIGGGATITYSALIGSGYGAAYK